MLVFARELFARSAPTSAWFVDLSSQCDQAYISTLTGTAPVPMRSCVSGGLVPLDAGPSKLSPSSSPAPGLIATAAWSSRLDCRLPSDQACASTPHHLRGSRATNSPDYVPQPSATDSSREASLSGEESTVRRIASTGHWWFTLLRLAVTHPKGLFYRLLQRLSINWNQCSTKTLSPRASNSLSACYRNSPLRQLVVRREAFLHTFTTQWA
ncbi:uncharacterized protein CLUP02_09998 [Colletotrichum lupini]|uniref:Uncharacterized protein n=1 Tax=Colletotrichum lupini TaxID=145971 RepID=A0A9Q8WIG8_9PEZI|nr:uncharacterized protein CLUP02_09998 [Colletotrichum lupini]UQC84501.1 hypothetical protein CLUP02_09998 [Colletotrichum lupini]